MNDARAWRSVGALAALVFAVLATHAAWMETPTVDEFAHVPAGAAFLVHGETSLYAKNPPLGRVALALPVVLGGAKVPPVEVKRGGWGPWRYGEVFQTANWDGYLKWFRLARLVNVAIGLVTGLVLFAWGRALHGERAAAICTALFFLCPTVIGHAHIATVDLSVATALTASIALLWWALRATDSAGPRFVAAGVAFGAALAVKFSAVLLLPSIALIVLVARRRALASAASALAIVVGTALVVVNAVFLFRGTLQPLGDFVLHSDFGLGLQSLLPGWLPVPLPDDYVLGFDAVKRDTESGEWGSYLFGRWRDESWWYYDLVALAVKLPLPVLLATAAAGFYWRGAKQLDALCLLVPPATILVFMMVFNSADFGIRYLLPAFPFLFLATGPLWRALPRPRPVVIGLALYYATMLAVVHPRFIGFFNLLAGGPDNGHRVLADSNLDMGQDLYRLEAGLAGFGLDHKIGLLYFGHVSPAIYGIEYRLVPPRPIEGVLAVSANFVVGAEYVARSPKGNLVPIRRNRLDWLREYEPVMRLGSMWIYDTRTPARGP